MCFVSRMFPYFLGMEPTLIIRDNTLSIVVIGVSFYALWDLFPIVTQGGSASPAPSLFEVAVTPPLLRFKQMQGYFCNFCFHILRHHSMFRAAALFLSLPKMSPSFSMVERLSPLICFPVLNHFGSVCTCWVYWTTFHIRRLFCFCVWLRWLMVPYRDNGHFTRQQIRFNEALSQTAVSKPVEYKAHDRLYYGTQCLAQFLSH